MPVNLKCTGHFYTYFSLKFQQVLKLRVINTETYLSCTRSPVESMSVTLPWIDTVFSSLIVSLKRFVKYIHIFHTFLKYVILNPKELNYKISQI